MTTRLCVLAVAAFVAIGCGSSSESGLDGSAGVGGDAGNGGSAGTAGAGGFGGGSAGAGGTEPKCVTPQDILRCSVVNIAHRGGRRIRPEHTLLAYDTALEDGTDILELDVHETSDGEIVVMHDDTLDRTTDCSGLIKEQTFEAIRMCDAGYDFTADGGTTYPYRGMGLVVPTLQEVLARYPETPFVIEIKQETPSMVNHFVEVLQEYDAIDKTVGAAFSDTVLVELREAAPGLATNLGVDETREFWLQSQITPDPSYQPPAEFLQIPLRFGGIDLLHPNLIPFAHSFDMKVHFWTINDEVEMRMLIEDYGIDGIMTDDPPLLTEVIEDLDAAPPE
jgi:glycerophosphoryl diester phosphodiesterase